MLALRWCDGGCPSVSAFKGPFVSLDAGVRVHLIECVLSTFQTRDGRGWIQLHSQRRVRFLALHVRTGLGAGAQRWCVR